MLVESQALRRDGDRWLVATDQVEIIVPPSIKALLEARIAQLPLQERGAIEPASVIGLQFPVPAVASMAPHNLRPAVEDHLTALEHKQLVHAVALPDEDRIYRFHHHLVRDTVYNGLLKRRRAMLHVEFVRWADQVNAERGRALEFEEILGYHLEQAHRCLTELNPLDEKATDLGRDAARRLASAARRSVQRGDVHAAENLSGARSTCCRTQTQIAAPCCASVRRCCWSSADSPKQKCSASARTRWLKRPATSV